MRNRPHYARELYLAVGALAAVAGLVALTRAIDGAPATALDAGIRRRVRRASTRQGRAVVHLLTCPGYPAIYFPATALLIGLLRRRGLSGSEALMVAAVGGWATHRGFKVFVRRRRPSTRHGYSNEYQAFPSGHTTATTAIAVTAASVLAGHGLLSRSAATALGAGLPLSIGVGRVLADHHWTTDVIGGWIAGLGVAAIALQLSDR